MNTKIIFLLFLLSALSVTAQFNETIRTGRPGQAIGPFSVGRNVIQLQSGFDINRLEEKNTNINSTAYGPNAVLRIGLAENFEINSGIEYKSINTEIVDSNYTLKGLSSLSLGSRIHLFDESKFWPSLGLQISLKTKLRGDFQTEDLAPKLMLIGSKSISKKLSLLVNLGLDYNGNSTSPIGLYVINMGYSFAQKIGTFIEFYGSFDDTNASLFTDAGFYFLVNNNLQFDLYGGIEQTNNLNFFISAGLSWRFLTKK